MNSKLLSLLGLARRAGRLSPGYDAAVQDARQGKAKLLLAARDVSDKTYKNLCYEAGRAGIPAARVPCEMQELGRACGIRAGVLSVTDEGFAKAVLEKSGQEKEDSVYGDKVQSS